MEQLIKQLDCFQDSLTPALSFVFLCHNFFKGGGKRLTSMKLWGSKPVLYMKKKKKTQFLQVKFIWKYFNKFNLCNLLRLIYIGRAKIISIYIFFFLIRKKRETLSQSYDQDVDKSSEWLTTLNRIFFILCGCSQSLSHVWLFATPWTVTLQAPLSLEFSRQEYWRRLPFPIPGDLPDIGIELTSVSSVSCVVRQILYHCTTSDAPSILSCFHSFENTSLY